MNRSDIDSRENSIRQNIKTVWGCPTFPYTLSAIIHLDAEMGPHVETNNHNLSNIEIKMKLRSHGCAPNLTNSQIYIVKYNKSEQLYRQYNTQLNIKFIHIIFYLICGCAVALHACSPFVFCQNRIPIIMINIVYQWLAHFQKGISLFPWFR